MAIYYKDQTGKLITIFDDAVLAEGGKVKSVNGQTGDVKIEEATDSAAGLVKIVTAIGEQDSAIVPTQKYIEAYLNDYNNQLAAHESLIQKKADKSELDALEEKIGNGAGMSPDEAKALVNTSLATLADRLALI